MAVPPNRPDKQIRPVIALEKRGYFTGIKLVDRKLLVRIVTSLSPDDRKSAKWSSNKVVGLGLGGIVTTLLSFSNALVSDDDS